MSYFQRSFKDGDTGRSCVIGGFANGQYDLPVRRRLLYSTRVVLENSKHPHLPEAKKMPQNAASAVMVVAGGWQKVIENSGKDKVHRPGRYLFLKRRLGQPVHQPEAGVLRF